MGNTDLRLGTLMKERISDNPTRPELTILKLLWGAREMSARNVHTKISNEFVWSYSTVRTVLERMTEKGLISKTLIDGINYYRAEVGKVAMLGRMIADFSNRVLELDGAPTAALFADSKLFSERELEELEAILREEAQEA